MPKDSLATPCLQRSANRWNKIQLRSLCRRIAATRCNHCPKTVIVPLEISLCNGLAIANATLTMQDRPPPEYR
jgi:hypothetical protein